MLKLVGEMPKWAVRWHVAHVARWQALVVILDAGGVVMMECKGGLLEALQKEMWSGKDRARRVDGP